MMIKILENNNVVLFPLPYCINEEAIQKIE